MEPNIILGYLERGIIMWYCIPFRFWKGYAIPFELSKDIIWSPNYFKGT
jgi:hypothetical protein